MKTKLKDLAILGGNTLFSQKLHVGAPNIGNKEAFKNRLDEIFARNWLTNRGPMVRELEARLSDYLQVKNVIALCNGTVALEIAIRALELRGEVLLPAFTFIATAHALQWQQIKPVFVDIDPYTQNIDPELVEKNISSQTSAIMGVHLWGRPCSIDSLSEIAQKHRLKLMFDAAHAFGSTYKQRPIGSFGDAEVFSFHATKVFNSFEGGAITTNNDALAEKIRLMQNFGFSGKDNVIYIGTNGKMSEVNAAMALTSLESVESFIAHNKFAYEHYEEGLSENKKIHLRSYDSVETYNYQYVVLEVLGENAQPVRDQLIKILEAENIIARRYFYPGCHKMEPYRSMKDSNNYQLKNTDKAASRILILPTGKQLSRENIHSVCQLINFVTENYMEVTAATGAEERY